jgi:hypothetical protein
VALRRRRRLVTCSSPSSTPTASST